MNTRNDNFSSSIMAREVAANSAAATAGILAAVKQFRTIKFLFTEECPLNSREDQTRLIMKVNASLHDSLELIEEARGEAQVPAYFAAVLLGTHGYDPAPIHLRYFNRPTWEIHIRDPQELMKLAEALELAASSLKESFDLAPEDICAVTLEGAIPYDAFDKYVNGVEPLNLLPELAFSV